MSTEVIARQLERTPAEINDQIARIVEKLVTRAQLVDNFRYPFSEDGTTVVNVGTNSDHTGLRQPTRIDATTTQNGARRDNRWVRNNPLHKVSMQDTGDWHTLTHTRVDDDKDKAHVTITFSDSGSSGIYTETIDANTIQYDLPVEDHVRNAAAMLMKLRGDIATQELLSRQDPQTRVDNLLN